MSFIICPYCGRNTGEYKAPKPTVDIIIELSGGIILIERRNPPLGWALPGGFVDYGESLEQAAVREALEETGLVVTLTKQQGSYSNPERDKRFHTISTVFTARADGIPRGRDDARQALVYYRNNLPPLAFDHSDILRDYFLSKDRNVTVQLHPILPKQSNSKIKY
jgi:ADP-ribose pyrophosphatase YjhB (NUDIX family)